MIEVARWLGEEWWRFILGGIFITISVGYVLNTFIAVINMCFNSYFRTLRFWNIRKHGYPENCDVDGDFKHENK